MIERLSLIDVRIKGFKSLRDISVDLDDDVSILIGRNGSGKTAILQSIAFVPYLVSGQTGMFFQDRGWSSKDVKSKYGGSTSPFVLMFSFRGSSGTEIKWWIAWDLSKGALRREKIISKYGNETLLLEYTNKGHIEVNNEVLVRGVRPTGSFLSLLEFDEEGWGLSERDVVSIESIKSWAEGVFSLELLSPTAMRKGTRGNPPDIGWRGERLGGFLSNLTENQKASIQYRLSNYYPIKEVRTTKKRAGWVDLRIKESLGGGYEIPSSQVSDGFLRMLALASIPEFSDKASLVMLDEIEDGIDPHILPDFVESIGKDSKCQILLTSHSPILVNWFEPKNITFITRDLESGESISAQFGEIDEFLHDVEDLGPGELWAHTDLSSIDRMVKKASSSKKED